MTQNEEIKTVENSFEGSKFGRVLLTIVSVLMIFAGPTYVIYVLTEIVKVNVAASFVVGFALFVAGLVLMRYLVQKKVVV